VDRATKHLHPCLKNLILCQAELSSCRFKLPYFYRLRMLPAGVHTLQKAQNYITRASEDQSRRDSSFENFDLIERTPLQLCNCLL